MRRRARFLRKARELAYRDLGGLVFDLHRFGQRNDKVVMAKLATLRQIDTEVRALEEALRDPRPVMVLREAGIAACPRCAAIHGSDDRFCPGCGLAFDANADRPLSTAPVNQPAQVEQAAQAPAQQAHSEGARQAPAPASQSPAAAQASAVTPRPAPTQAAERPFAAPAPPVSQSQATAQAPIVKPATASTPATAPAHPLKTTAAPFPSKPVSPPASAPASEPAAAERGEGERAEEDEPTQILRPPARGA